MELPIVISMTPADYSILKQTVKVKNAMWFCDKCVGPVGSFNSNNQADNSELLERLKTLEHTIETLTKSLTTLQGGQLSLLTWSYLVLFSYF